MDVVMIVYIVVAAIIGAAISYFICSRKSSTPIEKGGTEQDKIAGIKEQISQEYEKKIQEYEQSASALKSKYESLLSDSKKQIQKLDEQLKSCIAGNVTEEVNNQLAEVEKLKKKIKDLEEEIDDNEDDIDDYKKKLKRKTEENSALQNQISSFEKDNKRLKEETERLREDLEEKVNELNVKMESLCFVQEILSAKRPDDSDITELYQNVDNVASFVKGELRDCIKDVVNMPNEKEVFEYGITKWAILKKKSWIQGKTSVAFVGEFSAGKTSIVNRILSQDNPNVPLLPVSTKATTAIPTYISGGESTRYNFVTPDNFLKNISEDTFKRVNKEVLDQVKGVSSLIQYFVMTYKNPNLNSLSVLDTPGFNSNDKEDAQRTIEVINECDALFWVFDVNAGTVNRSSIELIKANLRKPLFVVINKVDTKASTEVNAVEQLIRKTLSENGISVQKFIRFSAKAPLKDIMEPINSVKRDVEQDAFMHGLLENVANLVNDLKNKNSEANKRQSNLFEQCSLLVDEYNKAISSLQIDCGRAANIPHYETHFFSSDKYEMSEMEYNNLCGLLDEIADTHVDQLVKLYNEQMVAKEEAENAYKEYRNIKSSYKELERVCAKLNNLINRLNAR